MTPEQFEALMREIRFAQQNQAGLIAELYILERWVMFAVGVICLFLFLEVFLIISKLGSLTALRETLAQNTAMSGTVLAVVELVKAHFALNKTTTLEAKEAIEEVKDKTQKVAEAADKITAVVADHASHSGTNLLGTPHPRGDEDAVIP